MVFRPLCFQVMGNELRTPLYYGVLGRRRVEMASRRGEDPRKDPCRPAGNLSGSQKGGWLIETAVLAEITTN